MLSSKRAPPFFAHKTLNANTLVHTAPSELYGSPKPQQENAAPGTHTDPHGDGPPPSPNMLRFKAPRQQFYDDATRAFTSLSPIGTNSHRLLASPKSGALSRTCKRVEGWFRDDMYSSRKRLLLCDWQDRQSAIYV